MKAKVKGALEELNAFLKNAKEKLSKEDFEDFKDSAYFVFKLCRNKEKFSFRGQTPSGVFVCLAQREARQECRYFDGDSRDEECPNYRAGGQCKK